MLLRVVDSKAMSEPLHLITTDERLRQYSELVVLL
jgi:PIN domain nuclease of toxin-antitoxin system